jgi:hypothetical protein
VSALTKSEIGRAVTALRELSEIIERLEKSTWPESQNDVLRKADGLHPRASAVLGGDDIAKTVLAKLADANARLDRLGAARDLDSQHAPRKTVAYETRGQ